MSNVNKRGNKPKMTLAMLKGKPSTLSVPSIRFSSGDEDVEMEESSDNKSKRLSGSDKWNLSDEKIQFSTSKKSNLYTSISADVPKDVSPSESVNKFAKRSTSLDSGALDNGKESISLFKELKGKLTKTVEETLRIGTGEDVENIETGAAKLKSPSLEMAEEAIELLDGECPESRLPSIPSKIGTGERLKQFSIELKNRKARLLNRGDSAPSQSWTMSALANRNQDDDALEDRLNTQYQQRRNENPDQSLSQEIYVLPSSPTPPPPSPRPNPPKKNDNRSNSSTIISNRIKWAGYILGIAILFFVPLPPFITGLVTGICLVVFYLVVHSRYIAPRPRRISCSSSHCDEMNSLVIPEVRVKPPEVHKGWMNELRRIYDSSHYHVGQTCPVLVRLEGSLLRISHPKTKIPRHASWNESSHDMTFTDQRYYNLAGSQIVLLPVGLTRKRLWSRKYPLCILLSEFACRTGHLSVSPTDDEISTEPCMSTAAPTLSTTASDECIYLFARTCREKEEWYWIFLEAMTKSEPKNTVPSNPLPMAPSPEAIQELTNYMCRWLSTNNIVESDKNPTTRAYTDDLAWLNGLISRIFWDFLRDPQWAEVLVARIQRKLSKIKLPYFMEELIVTSLELGSQLPSIDKIYQPITDHRGLWVDVDINYDGSPYMMTLETKLNLMKLKKESDLPSPLVNNPLKVAAFDSDEEDSAESSTDDDEEAVCTQDESGVKLSRLATSQGGGATSKKILRFVDKISQSRYFQHATEYKYVRKAMEGVSNTRLILTVELQSLNGTLALNIPQPPTDRLWYGFRTNPKILLVARPKLGEREVTVGSVTEWIEKKLLQEFQKVLVMPNMDDLVIPIMTSGIPNTSPLGSQGGSSSNS